MSDLNEWIKERRRIREHALTPDERADTENAYPALLTAVENVLELHTRIVTDQHRNGPTAVCEQCSENRMFALWPCETVEVIEGVIEGEH